MGCSLSSLKQPKFDDRWTFPIEFPTRGENCLGNLETIDQKGIYKLEIVRPFVIAPRTHTPNHDHDTSLLHEQDILLFPPIVNKIQSINLFLISKCISSQSDTEIYLVLTKRNKKIYQTFLCKVPHNIEIPFELHLNHSDSIVDNAEPGDMLKLITKLTTKQQLLITSFHIYLTGIQSISPCHMIFEESIEEPNIFLVRSYVPWKWYVHAHENVWKTWFATSKLVLPCQIIRISFDLHAKMSLQPPSSLLCHHDTHHIHIVFHIRLIRNQHQIIAEEEICSIALSIDEYKSIDIQFDRYQTHISKILLYSKPGDEYHILRRIEGISYGLIYLSNFQMDFVGIDDMICFSPSIRMPKNAEIPVSFPLQASNGLYYLADANCSEKHVTCCSNKNNTIIDEGKDYMDTEPNTPMNGFMPKDYDMWDFSFGDSFT